MTEIWTKKIRRQTVRHSEYWAKLRIIPDKKSNIYYYDITTGKICEEHAHYGFNLDGTLKFHVPRNQIQSIRHQVESKLHGEIVDEKIKLKNTTPQIDLKFQVILNGSTNESTVSLFDFELI